MPTGAQRGTGGGGARPVARRAVAVAGHLRRHLPLYACGTAWALLAAVLVTVGHWGSSPTAAAGSAAGGGDPSGGPARPPAGSPGAAGSSGPSAAGLPGVSGPAPAGGSGGGSGPAGSGPTGPIAPVKAGTGVTRSGAPCAPGVGQIAFSRYSPPCVARFAGSNGGATYRGVTATTITIALRLYADQRGPNQTALDKVNQQAGNPSFAQYEQVRDAYLRWFNQNFELYGRRVVIIPFQGQGNSADEASGQGQAAACADADAIATTVHAFGVVTYPGWSYDSIPFSECAARYHLWTPVGGASYPETWYRSLHPYVWGLGPDCATVEHLAAEFIGKSLADRRAQWAGASLQDATRKFGIYRADNPGAQYCVGVSNSDLKAKYGVSRTSEYSYTPDVSQYPKQAAQAVVQFKAAGVTTVELACDPISAIFLTQQADSQAYHPEWLLHGGSLTDSDGYARLYQADEVDGHLLGLSALGAQDVAGRPDGEAATAWGQATGGQAMPDLAWQEYYAMLLAFDQLQAAGPDLTPDAIAGGSARLPVLGGEDQVQGVWSLASGHTAERATQEVYWDSKASAADGREGDFIAAYDGRWFQPGELPAGPPPVKPE